MDQIVTILLWASALAALLVGVVMLFRDRRGAADDPDWEDGEP